MAAPPPPPPPPPPPASTSNTSTTHTDTDTDTPDTRTSTATCHCQAMKLTVPTPTEKLNECHCNLCRRYGAVWGYYRRRDVRIEGPETQTYQHGGKNVYFHRCATCGCMTHWTDAKKNAQDPEEEEEEEEMGVNCNLLDKAELKLLERAVDEDGEAPQFPVNNVRGEHK